VKELSQATVNFQGRRQALLRRYLFPLLAHASQGLGVQRDGVWYFVGTADQVVGRDVYAYGSYDEYVMAEAVAILQDYAGRGDALAGRTFVDIGANIGTSTITALRRFNAGHAIAFEPEPMNVKLLRCNVLMNELEHLVTVLPLALSDQASSAILKISEHNWGDHRVHVSLPLGEGTTDSMRPTITIELARFDDAVVDIRSELPELGMVWIDTQGYEGHILSGAPSVVDSDVPVVIEYDLRHLRRVNGLSMLNELITRNYREVVDIRASVRARRVVSYSAQEIAGLQQVYRGRAFTDLLLLK
jgi:FkbM family methyltransferase